jgi:hypothetical protein
MKYLVNGKRTITTENWQERMGDISIEDYAKENGFEIVNDTPIEVISRQQKVDYENELLNIKRWFSDNDYKVNKVTIGEWKETDARWTDYKKERTTKRTRQDELIKLLEG